jgi:hypothetical protein
METGGIILVFGVLLLGRGLIDVLFSDAVAASNRRRNDRVRSGVTGGIPATFQERRRPHAEGKAEVRRQGKNVLWFGAATILIGVAVMIAFP